MIEVKSDNHWWEFNCYHSLNCQQKKRYYHCYWTIKATVKWSFHPNSPFFLLHLMMIFSRADNFGFYLPGFLIHFPTKTHSSLFFLNCFLKCHCNALSKTPFTSIVSNHREHKIKTMCTRVKKSTALLIWSHWKSQSI